MIHDFIRAFFGRRVPWTNLFWVDRLPGEWRKEKIASQRQWHEPNEDGSGGIVYCEAILGPPSKWVRPPKSWRQRLENFRTLRRGDIRFFNKTWKLEYDGARTVTRPTYDYTIVVTNLSECCYEPLIYRGAKYLTYPPLYRLRCPNCRAEHLGRLPNENMSDES